MRQNPGIYGSIDPRYARSVLQPNLGKNDPNVAKAPVLIIEETPGIARQIQETLDYLDMSSTWHTASGDWMQYLGDEQAIHAILLGDCGSNKDRIDTFRRIKTADPYSPLILLVEPGDDCGLGGELADGVLARVELPLRQHAFDRALEKVQTYRENRHHGDAPRSLELFRNLVGSSPGISRVRDMIEMVADSDANVLIIGDSGTGKEVVARRVHHHSHRRSKPFVPLNCGAIPAELLESELFGHEKGAFTGAIASRQGRFEMADGGTLFLDEIGDMSLSMQIKLLRVLQERTFERVGSNKSVTVNVRIIAATHVNLEEAIRAGKFREDLFYRLNVFPIETPPLKERSEDLPLLVNDLVERVANEGRGTITLTAASLESLSQYDWPGNVRELANLIERLSILYPDGVVDAHDLPEKYRPDGLIRRSPDGDTPSVGGAAELSRLPAGGLDLKDHVARIEASLIQQALEDSDWIVAHAAKRLRMGRTTLVEKMRRLGLERRDDVSEI